MHAREPDEHTRIPDVVLLQVVRVGVFLDERGAVGEIHHHDERVRLGGFVRREARNILPRTFSVGCPHEVVSSTSGNVRPTASTSLKLPPVRGMGSA